MRIFEHPNMNGFKCPICGTNRDMPVTLVPIAGEEKDRNCKAEQVHVSCIDLTKVSMYAPIGEEWWYVQKVEYSNEVK